MKFFSYFLLCILVLSSGTAEEYFIEERFHDLEQWEPLLFPRIENHSRYSIIEEEGSSFLRAESENSSSGLIFKDSFDVYEWPVLSWRWKIDAVVEDGDGTRKSGDDYSIRIYVIFEYDPENATRGQKWKYNLARKIYGEYPPDSGLNYLWANKEWGKEFIPNSFSKKAIMIAMDTGSGDAGQWRFHQVNILDDYRKVFGSDPPSRASLAIMTDSDNTGNSGVGYIDYISVGE